MARPKFPETVRPVYELDPPEALTYRIYVRPKPPRQKIGLLHTAKRTRDAELAVRTIGQIVAMGDLAYKAGTPGIDPQACGVSQKLKVGDWVHYRQGAGQRLRVQRQDHVDVAEDAADDQWILGMSDTDVLGRFRDEAHASKWYDWIA